MCKEEPDTPCTATKHLDRRPCSDKTFPSEFACHLRQIVLFLEDPSSQNWYIFTSHISNFRSCTDVLSQTELTCVTGGEVKRYCHCTLGQNCQFGALCVFQAERIKISCSGGASEALIIHKQHGRFGNTRPHKRGVRCHCGPLTLVPQAQPRLGLIIL